MAKQLSQKYLYKGKDVEIMTTKQLIKVVKDLMDSFVRKNRIIKP